MTIVPKTSRSDTTNNKGSELGDPEPEAAGMLGEDNPGLVGAEDEIHRSTRHGAQDNWLKTA